MKPVSRLSCASLKFHADDACAAVRANPRAPKAPQYMAELHACANELERRRRLRELREAVAGAPADRLTLPLKHRRYWAPNAYARDCANTCALSLAYLRRPQ